MKLTEKQSEALKAYQQTGSIKGAARLLGRDRSTVRFHLRKAFSKEAGIPEVEGFEPQTLATDGKGNVKSVSYAQASSEPPTEVPPDHTISRITQLRGADGQQKLVWMRSDKNAADRYKSMCDAIDLHVDRYKGIAEPAESPEWTDASKMTVYPLGDPHVGMLSWAYETGVSENLESLSANALAAVDALVDRSPASDLGVLANLGDYFHADDYKNVTPRSGHQLDVDTRYPKAIDVGLDMKRRMIDRMLTKHKQVLDINVPGNHDISSSRWLNRLFNCMYSDEPRVSVLRNENPFIYLRWGKCLLGFTHGDDVKIEKLGQVMAVDRAKDWGETHYRWWGTGHRHTDRVVEFPGGKAEAFRTLAARDAYAHKHAYRSGRSMQSITFDSEWGECSRCVVEIREIEAMREETE